MCKDGEGGTGVIGCNGLQVALNSAGKMIVLRVMSVAEVKIPGGGRGGGWLGLRWGSMKGESKG
jgi:hypothetical protein